MERDWLDFKSLYNNFPGARDAFEKSCASLIRKIHTNNVQNVEVKRGDGGIDVFVGEIGIEPIIVYQCKFFLDELKSAQYKQIQNSFDAASSSKKFSMKKWILCLPKDLNLDENIWWSKWKKKQTSKYPIESKNIELFNGSKLLDLFQQYNLYERIFKIEELNLARDTNQKITKFIDSFNPLKSNLPKIDWSTYIGKQRWKNKPIIIGNYIFIGSAGNTWNLSDNDDGVYCIDGNSGAIVWFFQTNSDVNEICFYDGTIIGGCDNGLLFCLSAKTGILKWSLFLSSGITSRIFKNVGYDFEEFLVVTYDGTLYAIKTINGHVSYERKFDGCVMSNAEYINNKLNRTLYIPSTNGILYEFKEKNNKFELLNKYQITYRDIYNRETNASLFTPPIIKSNKAYIGYVRETYYNKPAIMCIELNSGKTIWDAFNNKNIESDFGNIRTNLILHKNEILFSHPYSNEICSVDIENGELLWSTRIGREMFQQWASPIVFNENIYLPRHDGYFYKVNLHTKEREWGLYLGENDDAGVVFDKTQKMSNENECAAWDLFKESVRFFV